MKNDDGDTPLHVAVARGHIGAVEAFLDRGAEIEAKDNDGNTPLFLAVQHEHDDVADMLRDHGARD